MPPFYLYITPLCFAPFWNIFGLMVGNTYVSLASLLLIFVCFILLPTYLVKSSKTSLLIFFICSIYLTVLSITTFNGIRSLSTTLFYICLIIYIGSVSFYNIKKWKLAFNILLNISLFTLFLDVLDDYFYSLESIFDFISQSNVYHTGNRPRAFFDEASVFANWLFGLIILGAYTHNNFLNLRNNKFILLLFSIFFSLSSLIIIYLFVIFIFSRYRFSIKLFYISLCLVILLPMTLYNDYLRYMFIDKIIFYLVSSDYIHDSGSIRAWFLFNGFNFVSNNPLGLGPGNSLGLVYNYFVDLNIAENISFNKNSAFLSGVLQTTIECGVFFIIILLFVFIKKILTQHSFLKSLLIFSSYVIIYLVIAPLYSLPYFLSFIPFFINKKYDNHAHR